MISKDMTPAQFRALERSTIRALAEEGRAMETAFRVFVQNVFPTASFEMQQTLRFAFFMGAHEAFALTMGGMDDDDSDVPTPEDHLMHEQVMEEIIGFAQRATAGTA